LPKALPLMRQRYPKLSLYLREDLTHRLISALKAGALDAALIALPYETAGLETAHIGEDELMAALPEGHHLCQSARVSPDRLEDEDLILLEDGHCLREHALAVCGMEPPRLGEEGFAATSLYTLVQMVGSGLGVSLVPAMAVEAGLARGVPISVMQLDAEAPKREIVIAWRKGSSRGVEGQMLADVFKDARGEVT
jgi:LysR family hydrogen peroxide-inducible transcriptional activator